MVCVVHRKFQIAAMTLEEKVKVKYIFIKSVLRLKTRILHRVFGGGYLYSAQKLLSVPRL